MPEDVSIYSLISCEDSKVNGTSATFCSGNKTQQQQYVFSVCHKTNIIKCIDFFFLSGYCLYTVQTCPCRATAGVHLVFNKAVLLFCNTLPLI